jgi:hypothetical protein
MGSSSSDALPAACEPPDCIREPGSESNEDARNRKEQARPIGETIASRVEDRRLADRSR